MSLDILILCLGVDSWVYLVWDFLCFLAWMSVSFPRTENVIISSNTFSALFPLLLLGPYNANVSVLDAVPEVT